MHPCFHVHIHVLHCYSFSFHGTTVCSHANAVQEREKKHTEHVDKKISASKLRVQSEKRSDEKGCFLTTMDANISWLQVESWSAWSVLAFNFFYDENGTIWYQLYLGVDILIIIKG